MDLSRLSDSDLQSLADGKMGMVSDAGLRMLAGEVPQPSLGSKLLTTVGLAARAVDSVTGAPARKAISEAQEGRNPVKGFVSQFGTSTGSPTGESIVRRAGVPDPYAAAAGIAMDLAADPTNALMVGPKVVGAIGKAAQGAKWFLDSPLVNKAADLTARGGSALGELLTGVPRQAIRTYAGHKPEIDAMIRTAGSVPEAADAVRAGYQEALSATKADASAMIDHVSGAASNKKTVDLEPVLISLETSRARLNPVLHAEDLTKIDAIMERLTDLASSTNRVSPKDIADATGYLHNEAAPAFSSAGIFMRGGPVQAAAKQAGGEARRLRDAAIPDIAAPFAELSQLHKQEAAMNKNLLLPDRPHGALVSAGMGTNERAAQQLGQLSEITGKDMVGDAKKLAAAATFATPELLSLPKTGATVLRAGVGGGLGYTLAGYLGLDPKIGAAVGAAMTSPAALKAAIAAGRVPIELIRKVTGAVGKLTEADFQAAYLALKPLQVVGTGRETALPGGAETAKAFADELQNNPGLEAIRKRLRQ